MRNGDTEGRPAIIDVQLAPESCGAGAGWWRRSWLAGAPFRGPDGFGARLCLGETIAPHQCIGSHLAGLHTRLIEGINAVVERLSITALGR